MREVIHLAVVDDPDRAILVADGLFAAVQINDAQTAVAQPDRPAYVGTRIIRSTMRDAIEHVIQFFGLNASWTVFSADATHILYTWWSRYAPTNTGPLDQRFPISLSP